MSNSQLGFLVAAVALFAALASVPAGILADRVPRMRLLAGSLVAWSAAMVASGLTRSFDQLMVVQLVVGVVIATAGPVAASSVGDAVPDAHRAQAIGWVRAGELVGLGAAFLAVGVVTSMLSWRWVFVVLAVLGAITAVGVWRTEEPERTAERREHRDGHRPVEQLVVDGNVEPTQFSSILEDAGRCDISLWRVVRYALDVPTNRLLLVAEMAGDFFLSGVATFAVLFATEQYGISQSTTSLLLPVAGVGALAGTVGGGRLGDWLVTERKIIPARLYVAAAGYVVAAVAVVPALFVRSVWLALPILAVAGCALAASIPTVGAARLDVIVGTVWGRVEAVRTVLRAVALASAPLVVGALSDNLAGGGHVGMRWAILLLLPLVLLNGLIVWRASRHYGADIAAARYSAETASDR